MDAKILSCIIVYCAIVVVICSYAKVRCFNAESAYHPTMKIAVFDIVFFSLIVTFYNFFCTSLSDSFAGGDRYNYFYSYSEHRVESLGLEILYNIARFCDLDFLTFVYVTTFICCMITFYALRKFEFFSLLTLLFLFMTDYFNLMFSQLKQSYANAVSVLFFAMLFNKKNPWRNAICCLLAFVASMFHTTGYILFLVFVVIKLEECKKISFKWAVFFVILVLCFFKPVMLFIASNLVSTLPYLSSKIMAYYFEESSAVHVGGSVMTFIKGFPFYFITFYGLIRKNSYEKIIPFYNQYLFLSFIGSTLYLLSISSYWLFRFTALFYIPIAVLFCQIVRCEKNAVDKYFAVLFVLGSLLIVKLRHDILLYINYGALI